MSSQFAGKRVRFSCPNPVDFLLGLGWDRATLAPLRRGFFMRAGSRRATIEAFFKERHLAATADDHALELATELELQHLDLSVGDAERIAREAVAERLASSRDAR
jgi:hypothetical protein